MTPRACPSCGTVSPQIFCPRCRAKGNIYRTLTAAQLRKQLAVLRQNALKVKTALEKLQEGECSNPT